jgi:predicted alpha-1,6-mannanase (GH76 family)
MERRFYLKIQGSAWDVRAETPEAAIEQIKKILDCYCTVSASEIGVDCDEAGWAIPDAEKVAQ